MTNTVDIAIIGAGLAGLSCAQALHGAGRQVKVFDKARGGGGRMATRRDAGAGYDHGAQYFTARDASFQAEVDRWLARGDVQPWQGRFAAWDGEQFTASSVLTRYVGVPGMSSICRSLLAGMDFAPQQHLSQLQPVRDAWQLNFEGGQTLQAQHVVLAVPAPQAAVLLPIDHAGKAIAGGVSMSPCWATMLQLHDALDVDFDGLFINSGPLSWAARNSSKPGRTGSETWVLHAAAAWASAHLDDTPEQVSAALTAAFAAIIGSEVTALTTVSHRWRYALAETPLETACLLENKLGLAGDWLHGSRVEGAWLSGQALASRLLSTN